MPIVTYCWEKAKEERIVRYAAPPLEEEATPPFVKSAGWVDKQGNEFKCLRYKEEPYVEVCLYKSCKGKSLTIKFLSYGTKLKMMR